MSGNINKKGRNKHGFFYLTKYDRSGIIIKSTERSSKREPDETLGKVIRIWKKVLDKTGDK